jgi:hypothetical protein
VRVEVLQHGTVAVDLVLLLRESVSFVREHDVFDCHPFFFFAATMSSDSALMTRGSLAP